MLAGGVGAAKFLRGLIRTVEPSSLTIVVNTGDDDRFFGLAVSPDLDTITYTLAGAQNRRTGWGLGGDSFRCFEALQRYYGPGWFHLGDRDLATHVYRSERLAAGARLSRITAEIADRFGVTTRVLPMTDDTVRTVVDTARGRLGFQEYLVQLRARPAVHAIRYLGASRAAPAPGVIAAIRRADAVILAPSNPFLSLGPMLAMPAIRRTLRERRRPVAAVAPIVGGRAVTGPLARLLRRSGFPVSTVGIARAYRSLIDVLLIDRRDGADAPALAAEGCRAVTSDLVFVTPGRAARASRDLLRALGLA